MKRMKRWIVLILSLILTCTLVAVGVWANTPDGSAELEVHYEVIPYRLNPVYEGVITLEDLDLPELPDKQPDADIMGNGNFVSEEKAVKQIRKHLKNREETFEVFVLSDSPNAQGQFDRMCEEALKHTGEATEGDYLLWHCGAMGAKTYLFSVDGKFGICYEFSVSYYTTAEQEEELTAAVDQLIRDLKLKGKSDYEKVCAVYDYMCENITYDYENLEDDKYLLKFSAYAALIDKTAVCQGYASLFYRLMLELDIDTRVIPGDGGGPHGWNIVELGDLYYNVDSTWDAGVEEYSYFLRNTWNFLGHYRYMEYETVAFHNEYPMAAEDYNPDVKAQIDPAIYKGMCGEDAYWTLTRYGQVIVEGTGPMYDVSTVLDSIWYYWQDDVTEAVIGEGITHVGDHAFDSYRNMSKLTLPSTLESIGIYAFRKCIFKEVSLPDGLTTIESHAFYLCSEIESITIPDSVTSLYSGVFYGCSSMSELHLGSGLSRLDSEVFRGCSALTEVVIPDNIKSIENAFYYCKNLRYVYIGSEIIGRSSFEGCTSLAEVLLSNNVKKIGAGAFLGCSALTEITIPSSVTSLANSSFRNCTGDIYFQGDAPYIDSSAFLNAVMTAYYPRNNKTWTEEVRQNYSGTITWEPYGVCEHETELRDMKDPTCTEPGYTGDAYCTLCGALVTRGSEIPPLGHTYETAVTEPTCAEAGYTTYTCTVCGESHQDDFVDPLPHTYETVVTEPTCTEQGYTTYTCTVCGESHQDDFVDPLGHLWDDEDAQVKTCVRCGFRFEGFMISFALDETVPVSSVWIDGVEYPVTASGEGYSVLLEEPDAVSMVVYLYNDPNAEDIHTQYPIGMRVWMLSFADNAYTATYVPEFDDLLQYYGTSIRITGNKGIRMITSLTKSNKSALTGNGLAGYKLLEYGTALCFASDLDGGLPMILGETYVRSNFAYKRDVADPVFSYEGDLMNYTNVLVGFSLDQCKDDIAMRPYIILEDAQGNPVTLYGGIVYRSIGYVALQNRNVFKPGSGSYDYVWEIIHHVYGDQYDADYKG